MMATPGRYTQPGSGLVSQMQETLRSLESSNGPDEAHRTSLQQMYALTRQGNNDQLVSSLGTSGITLLGRYGFEGDSFETRHLALRCLHNLLHQAPSAAQIFVDEGYLQKSIALMKSTDSNDEFLGARLTIICTNHSAASLLLYLENGDLAATINANIARHASAAGTQPFQASPACDANLSLLSLLTAKHEAQTYRFLDSLDPILTMLDRAPVQQRPLESPVSQLISCLVMIAHHGISNATDKKPWPTFNANKLVKILDVAIPAYQHEDLESRIQPLVSLLLYVASAAPDEVKASLKAQLLPSEQDRTQVLGKGDSLPHRMVKLSTEAILPPLKAALAGLLLQLSDRDPQQLADNVGYGCAVGLLHVLGMPAGSGGSGGVGGPLRSNPVTGQLLESEGQSSGPPMTEEEKEHEAVRLAGLFERLNRTGVMRVENPATAAMSSGRVEELPDDDEDDD